MAGGKAESPFSRLLRAADKSFRRLREEREVGRCLKALSFSVRPSRSARQQACVNKISC